MRFLLIITIAVLLVGSAAPAESAAPPPPDPVTCNTLPDCPYIGPTTVVTGLATPNAIAFDRTGALFVSQRPTPDLATLSILARGSEEEDPDTDVEERDGVDSSVSPRQAREIYRVQASAGFTEPTIGPAQFDRAGNAYIAVSEHMSADLLFVHRSIVRLDRRTYVTHELYAATGSDPALGSPASAGFSVAGDGTVYFGQFNSLYALRAPASPVVIATFGATARVSSAPVIETDGSLAVLVTSGPLGEIYSVRSTGSVRVAHLDAVGPGVSSFVNLAADAAGNLFTIQRVPHGFQRFNCADSTTIVVLRLDGGTVRTGTAEIIPSEVASVTQGGHLGLTGGTGFFRASAQGDVYFAVYPFVPICPPAPLPPFPFSNQVAARRVLAFLAQADGSLAPFTLLERGGTPPVTTFGAFSFAVRGRQLYVAAGVEGDITKFRH